VNHFASSRYWTCYESLSLEVRQQADRQFALLKSNPSHPSLHFKKVGKFRSARVNPWVRALATESSNDLVWFWIGTHTEYDRLIKKG
jgi:hypothetical protein